MKTRYTIKFIFFILALLIPLVFLNTLPDQISEIDNKYLADFPDIKNGYNEFLDDFDIYITERLGGRDKLITANHIVNDKLFDILEHASYEYGKDGYVFSKLGNPQYDFEFLDAFSDYLIEIQNYCNSRNVQFIYLLNPSKTTVYSDYLPDGYNYDNERLDYLLDLLDKKNINYVDNTSYLKEIRPQVEPFNVKFDAGHWNYRGAFYGVNNLLSKMHEYDNSIVPNELDAFELRNSKQTRLPVSNFPIQEDVPFMQELEASFNVVELDISSELEMDPNYRVNVRYESEADNDINALVFQGSYFNTYGNIFLARAFHKYQSIHNYGNIFNFEYFFNIYQPNFVVFTTAEYVTNADYFDFNNLKSKIFNPALTKSEFRNTDERIGITHILEGDYITKAKLDVKDIQYGYMSDGIHDYDLIHDDGWNISYRKEYMDIDNAKVYVVTDSGEKLVYDLDF